MNEQNNKPNNRKLGGFLRRGASRLTLGLGSSTLVLLITTAIALVAVSTVAWLSVNRNVQSTQAMDVENEAFKLGRGSAFGLIVNSDPKYDETNVETTLGAAGYDYGVAEDTAFWTSDFYRGIYCALNVEYSPDGTHLRPGAYGSIRFKIKPAANGRFTATIALSAMAKQLEYNDSTRTYKIAQDTDKHDLYVFLRDGTDDTRAYALELLKGHILLFADAQRAQRIEPGGTFRIMGEDNAPLRKGSTYDVTLYWYWPQLYSDLTYLVDKDTEIPLSPERYFYPADLMSSRGYDNGDKEIGSHISHVAAEILVYESDVLPEAGDIVIVAQS